MKLIILNGASCSGKSTIVKRIMKERDNLFLLHYDSLKWLFSQYSNEKHYDDVQKVMLTVAGKIFQMKYDVICDSGLRKISRDNLIDVANKYKYEIIEINLDADYEVLAKRFDERVKRVMSVPEKDRRISNMSMDRFKELYDMFQSEKNKEAIEFNTDTQTEEEISESIINILNK